MIFEQKIVGSLFVENMIHIALEKYLCGQQYKLSLVPFQRLQHCREYDDQHCCMVMTQFNFSQVEDVDIRPETKLAPIEK